MKKYRVNVNGTSYEIVIEEIDASAVKPAPPAPPPAAAPTPVATPAPAAAPAGAEAVNSPMPGTILAVNKNVGDTVKSGDVVMILEAMNMENEIMGARDGKVTSVNLTKGATVNSGDVLFTIE